MTRPSCKRKGNCGGWNDAGSHACGPDWLKCHADDWSVKCQTFLVASFGYFPCRVSVKCDKRNTWGSPVLHLYLRTAPEGSLHSFLNGECSFCPYLVERGRESLMVTHRVSLAKGGAHWVKARFILKLDYKGLCRVKSLFEAVREWVWFFFWGVSHAVDVPWLSLEEEDATEYECIWCWLSITSSYSYIIIHRCYVL